MSEVFVNVFVIFAFGICVSVSNNFTVIFASLLNIVDALKNLSVAENSTVSVLFVLSIFPLEYTYVNSGFIVSTNNDPDVFLSTAVVTIIESVLVPSLDTPTFLFPYLSDVVF